MADSLEARKHNWLVTHPRTASHLLVRILNLEEQGSRPGPARGYFFMPSLPKRYELVGKPVRDWTEDERLEIQEIEQKCVESLKSHIEEAAEQNQMVFIKEHALLANHPLLENEDTMGAGSIVTELSWLPVVDGQSRTRTALNKTIFSDEWLQTWNPTFLIRHPALAIPSLYRAMRHEVFGRSKPEPNVIERNYVWQRTLLEFYENAYDDEDHYPIVLEADDVIKSPDLMIQYAKLVGLDPEKLRFSWDKAAEEELNSMSEQRRIMLSSLHESAKADPSKIAGNLSIEEERTKWQAEFGQKDAERLETWVRAAMPHYEYMRSKRLTL